MNVECRTVECRISNDEVKIEQPARSPRIEGIRMFWNIPLNHADLVGFYGSMLWACCSLLAPFQGLVLICVGCIGRCPMLWAFAPLGL